SIQQDIRNMTRRVSNLRIPRERAQLLIRLNELEQQGDSLLDQIEELLGDLKNIRQATAARIDSTLNSLEREQILQQASVAQGTFAGIQKFISAFLKTSKEFEYARQ